MIVVPSFLPRSIGEARSFLRTFSRRSTPVELRIDGLRYPDFASILHGPRPPVIVTCRRAREGGLFTGTPREVRDILLGALSAGAELVDAEFSLGPAAVGEIFDAAGRRRIILSLHDPLRTPSDLVARFRKMASLRPAFVKIAVNARSFADTGRIIEVLEESRRSRQPSVAIAMNEFGTYTRILQGPLGGNMTFASADERTPTAPGQLRLEEMKNLYRVEGLDRRTAIFGLLGNPVSLSRGIFVHNAAFRKHGKNAVYVNFAADDAGEFMRILGHRITGLSVTMPFKNAVAQYLDALEGSSILTGSVNTVVRRGSRLTGLNTDFHAFLALLKRRSKISGRRLVVIGTGGTAATAAGAGALCGARIVIAGRNLSRAKRLAERFGGEAVRVAELGSSGGEILVNATPVGMRTLPGSRRKERLVPASALRNFALVCDFANPPGAATGLVDDAAARGLAVITGKEIFDAQSRIQSRLFLELA